MMANFNEFSAPERQLSDVVAPQQGVEDKSAATKAAGQAQLASTVGGLAVSAFQAQQESAARDSQAYGLQQYESLLKEEEDMLAQGVPRSKVNTWRTVREKEIAPYISFEDRLALRSKYDKAFGDVLTQETFEEKKAKADQELAINTLNVDPRTSEGQEAIASYRKVQTMTGADAAQVASALMPLVVGQADAIAKSDLPPEDKKIQLTMLENQVRNETISQIGDKRLQDSVLTQYTNLIRDYSDSIDPTKVANNAEALNRQERAKMTAAFYRIATPDQKALVATSEILGENAPLLFNQKFISEGPDIYGDLTAEFGRIEQGEYNPKSAAGKVATKAIAKNGSILAEKGQSTEGMNKAVGTMLEESSYKLPTASPDDVRALVEGLAGGIGEYYNTNPDAFPQEQKDRFSKALRDHYVDVVQPIVSAAFEERAGSKLGRVGSRNRKSATDRIDMIDVKVVGDSIVFTANNSEAKLNVEQLNKDISKDLTTYAKALANVTGGTLEEQVGILKDFLFPEVTQEPSEGVTVETEGVAPVSQEGVLQGIPVAPDEAIVLEKDLGERTLADVQGTPYEEEYKRLNSLLDTVEDPSLRYVLKKKYKDLLGDISSNTGTGDTSGKALSPALTESGSFDQSTGSELLGELPPAGGETQAPTIGDAMFEEVALSEGSGDRVTDVPTAHYGVTANAAKAVGAEFDEDMSEAEAKEISIKYLNYLDSKFSGKVKDWGSAPEPVKQMALDAAYNLGEGVFKYSGFMSDLKAGKTADEVGKNLLDTANVGGKSMKGLAVRRAKAYNKAAANKIDSVEQKRSGEIIYYDADGRIIFSYKPAGGKHPDSRAEKEVL